MDDDRDDRFQPGDRVVLARLHPKAPQRLQGRVGTVLEARRSIETDTPEVGWIFGYLVMVDGHGLTVCEEPGLDPYVPPSRQGSDGWDFVERITGSKLPWRGKLISVAA